MKKLPKIDTKVVIIPNNNTSAPDLHLHFISVIGRVVAVPKGLDYRGILVKFKPEDLTEEANKWTHNGFGIEREAKDFHFSKKYNPDISVYRFFPLHAMAKVKKKE